MDTFQNVRQPVLIARAVALVGPFLLGLLFWIALLVGAWGQIGRTLDRPTGPNSENEGTHEDETVTEEDADGASFTIHR